MRTGQVLTGLILIAGSGLAALVSAPVAAQEGEATREVGNLWFARDVDDLSLPARQRRGHQRGLGCADRRSCE